MSNKQTRLHPEIGDVLEALFEGVLGGSARVVPLELDGEGSFNEQLERATKAAAARHREECDTCRALHEQFGPGADEDKVDARSLLGAIPTSQDDLIQRHKAQIMALEKKHAAEREELARSFEPKAKAPPEYRVIGHMAFTDGDRPVLGSFEQDIEILHRKLKGKRIVTGGDITIKPVFAQF